MNSQIRQNLHEDCEAAINTQINTDLCASYVYLSMAYYFEREDKSLLNMSRFFHTRSKEECERAEKLMSLQNKRGGRIVLQDIKKPDRDDWGSSLEALESALQLDNSLHKSLLDLHVMATEHDDPHLRYFIESQYLDKQVKSINQLGDWVSTLHHMGATDDGVSEYLFDRYTMGGDRC